MCVIVTWCLMRVITNSQSANWNVQSRCTFSCTLSPVMWNRKSRKKKNERKKYFLTLSYLWNFFTATAHVCVCALIKKMYVKKVKETLKTFSIFYFNEHVRTRLWCLVIPFSEFLILIHLHVNEKLKIYHYHIDWRS